jgi:hypothetical protein
LPQQPDSLAEGGGFELSLPLTRTAHSLLKGFSNTSKA